MMLDYGVDVNTKCHGTPLLHLALYTIGLPNGQEFGKECFNYMFQIPLCDIAAKVPC